MPDGGLDQRLLVELPLDLLGGSVQQRAQLQVAVGLPVGASLGQQVVLEEVADRLGDGRLFLGFLLGLRGPVALVVGPVAFVSQGDQPVRRGFFIVDRTLLEDAWSPTMGTYDFRKFVQYRKTIQ